MINTGTARTEIVPGSDTPDMNATDQSIIDTAIPDNVNGRLSLIIPQNSNDAATADAAQKKSPSSRELIHIDEEPMAKMAHQ